MTTWTPRTRGRLRIRVLDGFFCVQQKIEEGLGNRTPGSPAAASMKISDDAWDTLSKFTDLTRACCMLYKEAQEHNLGFDSIDLGGLDPLGPTVSAVRDKFLLLTL